MELRFKVGDSKYQTGKISVKAKTATKIGKNKWKIEREDGSIRTVEYKRETLEFPSPRTIAYVYIY